MNKNGLELNREKKREVRFIIGDSKESGTGEYISQIVDEAFKSKYNLKVYLFFYGEEILEFAEKEPVDIFILIINSLDLKKDPLGNRVKKDPFERLKKNLQLIAQIKETYGRPVIVFGYHTLSYTVTSINNGCDRFKPFERGTFLETIEKLLE